MNKKYKIAYCTPSLYIPGGVERVLTTKANYLADVCGFDVYIILTDGKGKEPYYPLSPKVHVIQLDIDFEQLWGLSFLKKIQVYLKKQKIYKRKLKKVLMELKPDITVSLLRREINFITSIKDGSKKVGELHVNKNNYRNFEPDDSNQLKTLFSKIWMLNLTRKISKLDKLVVLSQEDRANWYKLDNVTVISNPLSFDIPDCQSDTSSHKVIAVGRYVYQKGFDRLLKAWQTVGNRHPDWELHIYGKGDKEEYRRLADELGIKNNLYLEEAVPDITAKYCESSIFVLSSRYEGFGMVITEAMSCGLPIISFDCPCGPKDIVSHCRDGYLVKNGDTDKMAAQLSYLITHESIRKKMGEQARINAERFKIDTIIQQWIRLFDEL